MKTPSLRFRSTLTILLGLTSILCFYAADNLIENGGGTPLGLTHDYLDITLVDYLFAGVVVFAMIGVLTIIAFIVLLLRKKQVRWIFISEGALLILWTIIQLWLGFPFIPLHLVFMALGSIFLFYPFTITKTRNQ